MIRTATEADLQAIVKVHSFCFPKSFTTAMGKELLARYYAEFMSSNPELFFVWESEGDAPNIEGFCMGYYGENSRCADQFIKKNRIRFALRVLALMVTGNAAAWRKVTGIFLKKPKITTVDDSFRKFSHKDSGELLSICVLPEKRGCGVASQLVDEYEKRLLLQGRHRCVLSVLANNARAIRFYEKKGFTLIQKIGDASLVYAKALKEESGKSVSEV